jgi:hypothetical protein
MPARGRGTRAGAFLPGPPEWLAPLALGCVSARADIMKKTIVEVP